MFLYATAKVIWVIAALLGAVPGTADMNTPEWITLNLITIGMAAFGIALGLALAQQWGKRLPGSLVILFSWIASGFLVSLLPSSALSALLASTGAGSGGAASGGGGESIPRWDTALIMIGFFGMAAGLLVAVPVYMRERWPRAFTGMSVVVGASHAKLPTSALVATSVPTLLWTYWAAGGTLGLNQDALGLWNLDARLLVGTSAAWCAVGAWSVWALSSRSRAHVPMWLPMTAGFVASGSLFAWNAWRALWALIPIAESAPMRSPVAAAIEHSTAMAAGLLILVIVLRAHRANA